MLSHMKSSTWKQVILKTRQYSKEKTCVWATKETTTPVFSCKYCEIFKSNFCYRTPVDAFNLTLIYTLNNQWGHRVLIMSYVVSTRFYYKFAATNKQL